MVATSQVSSTGSERVRWAGRIGLAWALCLALTSTAWAQGEEPRAHEDYTIELEPHFIVQWAHLPGKASAPGGGLRASIPIVQHGPFSALNNSLALGIGLDWAHFTDHCWEYSNLGDTRPAVGEQAYDVWTSKCTADAFWVPVVAQWNLHLSRFMSVFIEPGMSVRFEKRSGQTLCDGQPCDLSENDTNVPFVVWGGARFGLSNSVALTLRIGTPYVSAGASFFF